MATIARSALANRVRLYGQTLLAASTEPHADLLALVWGPRFDRQHAHGLLDSAAITAAHFRISIDQAANQFERLSDTQQERVRQLILRHRRQWDNARATPSQPNAPHPAH